jgi:hypothetical protein
MTTVMTVLGAAAKFTAIARDMETLGPAIVKRVCQMVVAAAMPRALN